jgi:hypothetical protein
MSFLFLCSCLMLPTAEGDEAAVDEYRRPRPRDAPYQPIALPGARLPHYPLRLLAPGRLDGMDADGGRATRCSSSVDLAWAANGRLVLLLPNGPALRGWLDAVRGVEEETGVPLVSVVHLEDKKEGGGGGIDGVEPVGLAGLGEDVAVVAASRWAVVREALAESGALLVRPDGHVAWRCKGAAGGGAGEGGGGELRLRLGAAVRQCLALD